MWHMLTVAVLLAQFHGADGVYQEARRAAIGRLSELNAVVETDAASEDGSGHPAVRCVRFNRPVNDADLECLQVFPEVEEVTFGYWAVWQGSTHSLSFAGRNVTDDGLHHVAKLTNLRRLGLEWTRISDRGLDELHELHDLEEVDILATDCTLAGVRRLKKAIPSCKIVSEYQDGSEL